MAARDLHSVAPKGYWHHVQQGDPDRRVLTIAVPSYPTWCEVTYQSEPGRHWITMLDRDLWRVTLVPARDDRHVIAQLARWDREFTTWVIMDGKSFPIATGDLGGADRQATTYRERLEAYATEAVL